MSTAYPAHRHHTTTHLSPSEALTLLSTYLAATTTDPSLHPNALLTENGPITPSSGSSTGLVLHNLKRVEAGLRGEHLAADLTFERFGREGLPGLMPTEGAVSAIGDTAMGGMLGKGQAGLVDLEMEGGWQDKEEFEREQEVVEGEGGRRDNRVEGGVEEGWEQVPRVRATRSVNEKEERKKAKRERRKQERQSLEAKRKRERDSED